MTIREVFFGSDRLTEKQENVRQLAMYPFAGVFTALANFVSFVIMDMILTGTNPMEICGYDFDLFIIIKQFVSWVATIITAYTTNRIFVFRSHGNFIIELLGFAAARLSTFLIIELALFSLMVYWTETRLGIMQGDTAFAVFGFNVTYLYVIKIFNNVVLVVMNFVLSKWLVFRAKDKTKIRKDLADV